MSKIVMQESIALYAGSIKMWFLVGRQFEYSAISLREVECFPCNHVNKKKKIKHYTVTVGGSDFYIPDYACVEYETEVPEEKQNRTKFILEEFEDKTEDVVIAAKEILLHDIDNSEGYTYNNVAYKKAIEAAKRHRESIRGAGYGKNIGHRSE